MKILVILRKTKNSKMIMTVNKYKFYFSKLLVIPLLLVTFTAFADLPNFTEIVEKNMPAVVMLMLQEHQMDQIIRSISGLKECLMNGTNYLKNSLTNAKIIHLEHSLASVQVLSYPVMDIL